MYTSKIAKLKKKYLDVLSILKSANPSKIRMIKLTSNFVPCLRLPPLLSPLPCLTFNSGNSPFFPLPSERAFPSNFCYQLSTFCLLPIKSWLFSNFPTFNSCLWQLVENSVNLIEWNLPQYWKDLYLICYKYFHQPYIRPGWCPTAAISMKHPMFLALTLYEGHGTFSFCLFQSPKIQLCSHWPQLPWWSFRITSRVSLQTKSSSTEIMQLCTNHICQRKIMQSMQLNTTHSAQCNSFLQINWERTHRHINLI